MFCARVVLLPDAKESWQGMGERERKKERGKRKKQKKNLNDVLFFYFKKNQHMNSVLCSRSFVGLWHICKAVQPIARQMMEGVQQLHDFGIVPT